MHIIIRFLHSYPIMGGFMYAYVILACTLLGFRSTAAVVALSQMAVGDGLAEISGRKFGTLKWYFNDDKSYAGRPFHRGMVVWDCKALPSQVPDYHPNDKDCKRSHCHWNRVKRYLYFSRLPDY